MSGFAATIYKSWIRRKVCAKETHKELLQWYICQSSRFVSAKNITLIHHGNIKEEALAYRYAAYISIVATNLSRCFFQKTKQKVHDEKILEGDDCNFLLHFPPELQWEKHWISRQKLGANILFDYILILPEFSKYNIVFWFPISIALYE